MGDSLANHRIETPNRKLEIRTSQPSNHAPLQRTKGHWQRHQSKIENRQSTIRGPVRVERDACHSLLSPCRL